MNETLMTVLVIAAIVDLFLIAVLALAVTARVNGSRIPTPGAAIEKRRKKKEAEKTTQNRNQVGQIIE